MYNYKDDYTFSLQKLWTKCDFIYGRTTNPFSLNILFTAQLYIYFSISQWLVMDIASNRWGNKIRI